MPIETRNTPTSPIVPRWLSKQAKCEYSVFRAGQVQGFTQPIIG